MAKFMVILTSIQFSILFMFILFPSTNAVTYNVMSFGAKPDGKTTSTIPFLKAWAVACKSIKPATIYVPQGKFLVKQAEFWGPCRNRITFQIDGTIVAPKNYLAVGNSGNWIWFLKVTGLTVLGGTLDAQGAGYWACKTSGKNCPQGARSLSISNSQDILISGLTSINSQQTHLAINSCNNVMVRKVKIIAPDESPNTDGIHIQTSTEVTISDASIKTGDDCISIGPGAKKLLIERVGCGPGHGISIGSLAKDLKEEGVQDITVRDVTFTGSENGLRIKSWARPSNGFVKNVLYQNIVMNNVKNPIIIDQRYCPSNQGCPNQHSGVKISGVTYQNIKGTSATPIAVKFDCSLTNPCQGLKLQNVKLTHYNKPALSVCLNTAGSC